MSGDLLSPADAERPFSEESLRRVEESLRTGWVPLFVRGNPVAEEWYRAYLEYRVKYERERRLVSRLRSRLARVLGILNDKVDGMALRPAPKIGRGKKFCKRGAVWSRRVPGGRRTGGEP